VGISFSPGRTVRWRDVARAEVIIVRCGVVVVVVVPTGEMPPCVPATGEGERRAEEKAVVNARHSSGDGGRSQPITTGRCSSGKFSPRDSATTDFSGTPPPPCTTPAIERGTEPSTSPVTQHAITLTEFVSTTGAMMRVAISCIAMCDDDDVVKSPTMKTPS